MSTGPEAGNLGDGNATTGGSGPRLVSSVSDAKIGLHARNIGKRYKRRPVLLDVSVSVTRGEAVGLWGLGRQTTCFYIVTGLISADLGSVTLDGDDITIFRCTAAPAGIGYLPQEYRSSRLTVEQNIMAVLEVVERSSAERERMLEDLLAEFSIAISENPGFGAFRWGTAPCRDCAPRQPARLYPVGRALGELTRLLLAKSAI